MPETKGVYCVFYDSKYVMYYNLKSAERVALEIARKKRKKVRIFFGYELRIPEAEIVSIPKDWDLIEEVHPDGTIVKFRLSELEERKIELGLKKALEKEKPYYIG